MAEANVSDKRLNIGIATVIILAYTAYTFVYGNEHPYLWLGAIILLGLHCYVLYINYSKARTQYLRSGIDRFGERF